ncbi:hypothetical protein KY092_15690 [Natronomonas gomsonensis]|uniref:DUF5805 domain-containing protein n=1 Tax=Natronomonas gomsonensis TaxID=1046043 RepID=UPI0020CA472C|nr:DUF5805 domain-containing protein [Natronomonas gomsonensis]MCY4732004.1 hypothetical protein [Natronomonas gomsonensis]
MSSEGERVSVQTYVSSTQRERWREEADELDMSQAEYVRTMIQAGRRSFDLNTEASSLSSDSSNSVEARSPDATPRGEGLKDRVLEVLRAEEFADWELLLAGVTDDIEERLEETLDELQSEDRIRYSGRHGGYTVVDDGR